MKRSVLLTVAAVAAAAFSGCPDGNGGESGNSPATTPATEVTIAAEDGTDFGTVSLGNEVTKKFRIKTDGYIGSYSYALPAGFESSDLESVLKSMEETAGTSGEFSVTFSPLFNGASGGDITVIADMFGGAEGSLEVTAVGSGTALKAPDAADKTLTVIYAYMNSGGTPEIDSGAVSLDLNPDRPAGVITVTADYYVGTQYRETHSGFINYDYSAFPNDPSQINMTAIRVTVNQTLPAEANAHFFIEGQRIDINWSETAGNAP